MTTRVEAGAATHVGRVRQNNEDVELLAEPLQLYGVADGMGGHQAGEVAAAMAVAILSDRVVEGDRESLLDAVRAANREIYSSAGEDAERRGMGTTICAVCLVQTGREPPEDDEVAWVNVGDSRLYLYRDDDLLQLSTDHSLVEDLRATGQLTDEEAAVHPHRNVVTRALGIDADVQIDSGAVVPFTGDRFLLCSDGLYEELSSDQMAAALRRLADPGEAADELVRQAVEHGGRDNVTVVVVDVVDDGGRSAAASGLVDATAGPRRDDVDRDATKVVAGAPPRPANESDDAAASGAASAAASGAAPGRGASGAAPGRARGSSALATATRPAASAADLERTTGRLGDARPVAPDDPAVAMSRRERRRLEEADQPRPRRLTWRVAVFVLVLVAVLAVAVGAIGWFAKRTYYVAFAGANVAVYQGQPGGVLFFDPTVAERTKLQRSQLTQAEREAVAKRPRFASLADARGFTQTIARAVAARGVSKAGGPATTTAPGTITAPTTAPPTTPSTGAPATTTSPPTPTTRP
ncbi:MAG: serine/threonine-protein phosphatase [Actinobacteria bacterium]|nr:serine/threonine-protein phosphatase [Actinomycetota bacterium]